MSSLIVLVPQSIAATFMRHGPDLPPLPEQVEHLVTERVHATALGERLAREDSDTGHVLSYLVQVGLAIVGNFRATWETKPAMNTQAP